MNNTTNYYLTFWDNFNLQLYLKIKQKKEMGKTKILFQQNQEQAAMLDDEYWYEKHIAAVDKTTFGKTTVQQITEHFYPQLKTKTNDKQQ